MCPRARLIYSLSLPVSQNRGPRLWASGILFFAAGDDNLRFTTTELFRWGNMLPCRVHILVLLGLLATNCLAADPVEHGERLIAQPPAGWQSVFTLDTERSRLAEFIPGAEDKGDWTAKITFESFIKPDASDPIVILLKEADRYRQKCKFLQHFNLFSGEENGYPTSFRLIMCGASNFSGKGEVLMLKAIQGDEYFYILKLLKRVAAFEPHEPDITEGEIAEWAIYFKRLIVCDGSEGHACPQGKSS